MKTCPQCGKSYPLSRVLCQDCCEILEEEQYLRLILVTLVIAVLFHFTLGRYGYAGRGLIRESLMTEFFLLAVCVLIWKTAQKWRSPQRRILHELVSLYGDRFGRVALLGLSIFAVLSLSRTITFNAERIDEPHALVCFRAVRYYAVLGFGASYLLLTLCIARSSFFDFRLKHSLIPQELKQSDALAAETIYRSPIDGRSYRAEWRTYQPDHPPAANSPRSRVQKQEFRLLSANEEFDRSTDVDDLADFICLMEQAIEEALGATNDAFELLVQTRLSKDKRPSFGMATKEIVSQGVLQSIYDSLGQLPDFRSGQDDLIFEVRFLIAKRPTT